MYFSDRRISFEIIPDKFKDNERERDYLNKVMVVIDYLERLAQKKLEIGFVQQGNAQKRKLKEIRFKVNLRRNKRDKFEWMEVVVDPDVDTTRTFRIVFHWLVATSIKIDSQIKALQRKCQGLNLVCVSFSSSASKMYMHPVSMT